MSDVVRCSQCHGEIQGCSRQRDWGYKLGANMYFCTYGCMRAKQASIDAKRAETNARKAAEKEARKQAKKEQKAKEAARMEELKMEAVTAEPMDTVEEAPGVKLVRMDELMAVKAKFSEVQEQHQKLMEKIKEQEVLLAEMEELKKEGLRLSAEVGALKVERDELKKRADDLA